VLVGANGAGKSNFLEVFDLVGEALDGNLRSAVARRGRANRILHHGAKRTDRLHLRFTFGPNGYEADLRPAQDGLYFEVERSFFHGDSYPDRPFYSGLGVGHVESRLPEAADQSGNAVARWTLETMVSWRRFHFHDTSPTASLKQAQPIGDNRALRRDAANLAPFLFRLRKTDPAAYGRIVSAVRQVAPFFADFALAPNPFNEESITLEWKPADGDHYGSADALSDGSLRFMCLATLLLQPDPPSLILIDEPELGLHPFAVVALADLVRSAAADRRLILSTQSVTLLNQFDLEDVIVVNRADGASTFDRLEPEGLRAWVDDYAIGELWEKNLIGGRPARA
jgi:predicted ATPase